MTKTVLRAPFAVTTDGDVVMNVAMFDVPRRLDLVVALAARLRGAVFVGVLLNGREVDLARDELWHASRDTAARIAGRRRKRGKKK